VSAALRAPLASARASDATTIRLERGSVVAKVQFENSQLRTGVEGELNSREFARACGVRACHGRDGRLWRFAFGEACARVVAQRIGPSAGSGRRGSASARIRRIDRPAFCC
jgi:hypothetical protein